MIDLPDLGVGMGFRQPYLSDIFLNRSQIDFLEITADHYIDASKYKSEELNLLASHFPLIPHGLDLSIGSAEGIDLAYLEKLVAVVEKVKAPWWSEHIAFTKMDGIPIGHLAPLPPTEETLDVLCENIETVRKYIKVPLILENITYMVKTPGEMSESVFLKKLVERTNCGLLLDLTNVYTNSINHNFCMYEFAEELPLENVVQFHFVGGHWNKDLLIDSHSKQTPKEVWQLMEWIMERTSSVKGMILERDEDLPDFGEIKQELQKAKNIRKQALEIRCS